MNVSRHHLIGQFDCRKTLPCPSWFSKIRYTVIQCLTKAYDIAKILTNRPAHAHENPGSWWGTSWVFHQHCQHVWLRRGYLNAMPDVLLHAPGYRLCCGKNFYHTRSFLAREKLLSVRALWQDSIDANASERNSLATKNRSRATSYSK